MVTLSELMVQTADVFASTQRVCASARAIVTESRWQVRYARALRSRSIRWIRGGATPPDDNGPRPLTYGLTRLVLRFAEGLGARRQYMCAPCIATWLHQQPDEVAAAVRRLLDDKRVHVFAVIRCTECGGTPVVTP